MLGEEFEREVRAVARARWNLLPGEGAAERFAAGEVDCVCKTEDVVHLIECTTERSTAKVNEQVNKLHLTRQEVVEREGRSGRSVRLWIVTREEPTPDQRTAAHRHGVNALSLMEFRKQLMDSGHYRTSRWNYRFGSAEVPETGSTILGDAEYVPTPITDTSTGDNLDIEQIADLLLAGRSLVLLGSFGAGKSFTLRQVFREVRSRSYRGQTNLLPLALNLREHWGQTDVAEAIERHAKRIGYLDYHKLVRAWNACQCIVLLDGFDELASQGWQLATPREFRPHRLEAVTLVRNFIQEAQRHRPKTGVLLAGRDNYFDSINEMRRATNLPEDSVVLRLQDFTDEQAERYLRTKLKKKVALPHWLPRKPLLISYLPVKGLLEEVLRIGEKGPAYAWNQFLDNICQREASLNPGSLEAPALRQLLEYLSTKTRETTSGLGPLTESDVIQAYRKITRSDPLEPARVLLVRLPGLTARNEEDGTRSFLDVDMLDALRANDVARFIEHPHASLDFGPFLHPLNELGCSVVALLTESRSLKEGVYVHAASQGVRREQPTLALDCVFSATQRLEEVACKGLAVSGGFADVIDLENCSIRDLRLENCYVRLLRLGEDRAREVWLTSCVIERIEGVSKAAGLPDWIKGAEVQEFEELRTTAAILRQTKLPLPVRVLLTCLRKIFEQRGGGRVESALYRGLDQRERRFVGDILTILASEGAVYSTPAGTVTIWHPNRAAKQRVNLIQSAPMVSEDDIVKRVRDLR